MNSVRPSRWCWFRIFQKIFAGTLRTRYSSPRKIVSSVRKTHRAVVLEAGAPGLYGDSPADIAWDNLKIISNR